MMKKMFLPEFLRRQCGYKFPKLGAAANRLFFKVTPRLVETELFPGIRIQLDTQDLTQRTTYWQGNRFEYPTAQILAEWGKAGATMFFDIGANYGFFSYWMLSQFRNLAVHSFEPNPKPMGIIERTKARNGLENLHPQAMGLSDAKETLSLHLGTADSGHSTFGDHPEFRDSAPVSVPVLPFDEWRKSAGIELPQTPRWVAKVDVEGFELRVLRGMGGSLKARAFIGLVIEVNPFTMEMVGTDTDQILSFMENHGYKLKYPLGTFKTNQNGYFIPR